MPSLGNAFNSEFVRSMTASLISRLVWGYSDTRIESRVCFILYNQAFGVEDFTHSKTKIETFCRTKRKHCRCYAGCQLKQVASPIIFCKVLCIFFCISATKLPFEGMGRREANEIVHSQRQAENSVQVLPPACLLPSVGPWLHFRPSVTINKKTRAGASSEFLTCRRL